MSLSAKRLSVKLSVSLCIAIASTLMSGCSLSTKPSLAEPSSLVIASCPNLTPLTDNSFGATADKLIEVSGHYYRCRKAVFNDGRTDH